MSNAEEFPFLTHFSISEQHFNFSIFDHYFEFSNNQTLFLVEMKWSERSMPSQCRSSQNCTEEYQYQYSPVTGKSRN